MRQGIMGAWNGLLDVVYPPICLLCRSRLECGALCSECVRGFAPVAPPFCARCGAPIPIASPLCSPCLAGLTPAYDWSQALGEYTGPLRTAIHRLKYDGKTVLAEPLGRLLARALDDPPSRLLHPQLKGPAVEFDLVTPVPLH